MDLYYFYTTSAARIRLDIKLRLAYVEGLTRYEDKLCIREKCEKGCVSYGRKWSCPPFSPSFSDYSRGYPSCVLILFYCRLNQFHYIQSDYMKVRAANSILRSQTTKLARYFEEELSGRMLSGGSCRSCKTCAKVQDKDCKNPSKLRFSLEALGLNQDEISRDYFNHQLLRYENRKAPEYSTVLSGVLMPEALAERELEARLQKFGQLYLIDMVQFI